jgi:hypothetical protein
LLHVTNGSIPNCQFSSDPETAPCYSQGLFG